MGYSLYCIVLCVLLFSAQTAAQRTFAKRVGFNIKGELVSVGNTSMLSNSKVSWAPNNTPTNGNTSTSSNAINDYYYMRHVDVDNNGTTFNSSSADLNLPVSSDSVLWAGLYWHSYSNSSYSQSGVSANAYGNRFKVKFRKAGGTYTQYTATQQDQMTTSYFSSTVHNGSTYTWYAYQGFFDMTDVIRTGGSGTYEVANIVCPYDAYGVGAGWALVVIYQQFAGNETKNLVVFDGLQCVQPNSNTDIALSGFKTPNTGTVYSEVGVFAFEGDLGLSGDQIGLRLPGTPITYSYLGDSQSPSGNFFNSSISRLGSQFTAKNPNYINQLGTDVDLLSTAGVLPIGTTSTTVHLTTYGDLYFPGVVTFETEINGPAVATQKLFYDVGSNSYMTGLIVAFPPNTIENRTVQYHFNIENSADESALSTTLIDTIPMYQDYITGSMQVSTNGTTWSDLTDASDGDAGYYDVSGKRVIIGIGNNATSSGGGQLLANSLRYARFKTLIQDPTTFPPPLPNWFEVPNFAKVTYTDTATYAFEANSTGVMLNIDNSLPVELTAFAVRAQDGNAIIDWRTATESNNYGFEVERSSADGAWSQFTFVPGHGTCNTPNSYRVTDENAAAYGTELRYRLKMLDRNGDVQYSDAVEVSFASPATSGISSIYPNPVRSGEATAIRYTVVTRASVLLTVYDMHGKPVARLAEGPADTGSYSATFFTDGLSSGMYVIEYLNGSTRATQKVVVKK